MDKVKSWIGTIFTGDVCISKKNLPVLVVVCIFSLIGAMYFGMFFARQEVLRQSQLRQDEIVRNFATLATSKDTQITALTLALTDSQTAHRSKLTTIEDLTTEIAMFLATATAPLDGERMERLRERIKEIQATAKVGSDGASR